MAFLTRNRIRIHCSGPGFDLDLRWTERMLGGRWRADIRLAGEWVPEPTWDADNRVQLVRRFAELNRLANG